MKSFTLNRVIFSAGALFLGIILLIWPTGSLYFLAKFIGVFLAVGGFAAGVMYFQDHDSAMKSILLVLALVMLICGAVIFLHPEELIKLIPTIFGMMIVVSGLINLGETFILSRSKYKKWWISLIIAVITIACGIFVINRALGLASLITRIAGGVLIFDGASHLWVTSRVYKSSKDKASTVEGSAVEVKPETNGAGAAPADNSPAEAGGGTQEVSDIQKSAEPDKPEVPGSNAFANFDGSVKLIDFLSKTGMYNDVFTVWQKEGTYAAYKGRELMAADSGCDSPAVYGGQPFAEFYPEGLNMTGEGFSWRIVINTLHEDRCLPVLEEEKRREIFAAGIKPGLKVAALRPYPGFSYEDVSVENADAVLVYGYHSGTFCTGEGAGEVKDRSLCIQTLTEKSKSAGRPLYIAPFKEDKKIYESAKALEGENVIKLYDMSFEAAYVNCLLLETSR